MVRWKVLPRAGASDGMCLAEVAGLPGELCCPTSFAGLINWACGLGLLNRVGHSSVALMSAPAEMAHQAL